MAVRTFEKPVSSQREQQRVRGQVLGVTSLGLVNFLVFLWITEQGGTATCYVHLLGQGSQAEALPGKCHLCPCSFCTGLCGFCSTVRIPPITILQSFTKTSLGFTLVWTLRTPGAGCFLQVKLQQDQRVWQLAQGRLAQVFLSVGLLPHWLHLPWILQLEWTFRNHHVHSRLCFLASFLSDGFPQTFSAIWMSQVDSPCFGLGRKCL